MWSNTIFNQYSTFQGQYALELLHSCDSHFDKYYFENENLRNKMIDLANRDDHCFYQLALHAYQYCNKIILHLTFLLFSMMTCSPRCKNLFRPIINHILLLLYM